MRNATSISTALFAAAVALGAAHQALAADADALRARLDAGMAAYLATLDEDQSEASD